MNQYVKPNSSAEITLITPDHAAELLKINTKNRRINRKLVAQYSRDMANNSFDFNGNTICVSNTNILLDGQQRLTACLETGKPFWTILVKDLEERAMVTIDSGRKRVYADRLKVRGYTNHGILAATITHVALIALNTPKNSGLTSSQLDDVFQSNPSIVESADYARNTFTRCDKVLGAIHYIATQTGFGETANSFIKTWKDGQINYEDDPIIYVRNLLIKDAHRLKKMTTVHKHRLILLSWNKFKTYSTLKNAKVMKAAYAMDGWDESSCNLKS
jgi:hypothetical protein